MNLVHDTLTGAYQRDGLLPTLEHLLAHAVNYTPCSVLFIDIDYFKSINDAFGHARGDDVLRLLGAIIRHHIRENDLLFRYGGDELVLILPNSTQQEALRLGQRLLSYFQTTAIPGTPPLRISLSMGVATVPDDATTAQELLRIANERLHMAKTNGRAQIASADHGTRMLSPRRILPPLPAGTQRQFRRFCRALNAQKRTTMGFLAREAEARFLFRACAPLAKDERTLWLSIEGAPARQHRLFGALAALTAPHPPPATASALADFLQARAERRQAHAVGLFVFHADMLDPGTQSILETLHTFSTLPLGVVWHTVAPSHLHAEMTLQIGRLSAAEIHTWLEATLQAPVERDAVAFLLEKSGGTPAALEQWLRLCLDEHLLVFEKTHWRLLPAHPTTIAHTFAFQDIVHAHQRVTDLPSPPPLFVGREEELYHLSRWFEQPTTIGVSGAPGSGKTTLVAQAAREAAHLFDQVLFIQCNPASTPEMALTLLYTALGAPPQDAFDTLQAILAQTRTLLVLDSPPAAIERHAFWRTLLNQPGSSTIVVIAADLPDVAWKHVLHVRGLPVPQAQLPFEAWPHEPTLWLLRALIRQSIPEFEITPTNLATLVQICRFMDGVPQALDMAAALLSAHDGRFIQTWAEQLLHLPRESIPLASIHMYMLKTLAPSEQAALQALAVFPGAFSPRAARAVAGVSPFLLAAFGKIGLLQSNQAGMFQLKPFLRLMLWQQIQDTPSELHAYQHMLKRFYTQRAIQYLHDMRTDASRSAQNWVTAHLPNIEHVWTMAIETNDASTIITLGELMHFYFDCRNAFAKGRAFFAQAFALPVETKAAQHAASLVHSRYAIFCRRLGLYELSEHHLNTALRLAREAGVASEEAFCQNHLGYVFMRRGMYEDALQCVNEAHHLLRAHPDPHLRAVVYNTQGMVYESMQRYTEAYWAFLRSLALFCRYGDQRGIAFVLNNFGIVKEMCGAYDEAEACYQASQHIFDTLGDRWGRQLPLMNLGDLAVARNQLDVAYHAYGEAIKSMRKFMNMPRLYSLMNRIAILLEQKGRVEEAITLHLFITSQPSEVVNMTDHERSREALHQILRKRPDIHVDSTKSPALLRLEALHLLITLFPSEQAAV